MIGFIQILELATAAALALSIPAWWAWMAAGGESSCMRKAKNLAAHGDEETLLCALGTWSGHEAAILAAECLRRAPGVSSVRPLPCTNDDDALLVFWKRGDFRKRTYVLVGDRHDEDGFRNLAAICRRTGMQGMALDRKAEHIDGAECREGILICGRKDFAELCRKGVAED